MEFGPFPFLRWRLSRPGLVLPVTGGQAEPLPASCVTRSSVALRAV